MRFSRRLAASAAVCLSLLANSTAAVASTTPPQSPNDNAWLTLSMLTPSGAAVVGDAPVIAVCSAAAAAAVQAGPGCVLPQLDAAPAAQPPAPPPPQPQFAGAPTPPIPVMLVWLAVIGLDLYLALKHDHHGHPNSPA